MESDGRPGLATSTDPCVSGSRAEAEAEAYLVVLDRAAMEKDDGRNRVASTSGSNCELDETLRKNECGEGMIWEPQEENVLANAEDLAEEEEIVYSDSDFLPEEDCPDTDSDGTQDGEESSPHESYRVSSLQLCAALQELLSDMCTTYPQDFEIGKLTEVQRQALKKLFEDPGPEVFEAREKLIRSIGECHRLTVELDDGFSGLRLSELEIFLQSLRPGTIRGLVIKGVAVVGSEAGCALLAEFLRASRCLEKLQVCCLGCSDPQSRGDPGAALAHVARGLSGSKESNLRKLTLIGDYNHGVDKIVAGHIAGMLAGLPNLQELGLEKITMDDEGAKRLAEAVANHRNLHTLVISGKGGLRLSTVDMFLKSAFNGPAAKSSVKVLSLAAWSVGGAGPYSQGCQEIFATLRQNSSVEDLSLNFHPAHPAICLDAKSFDELLGLIRPGSQLVRLDLDLNWQVYNISQDWPAFFRTLKNNSALASLRIVFDECPSNDLASRQIPPIQGSRPLLSEKAFMSPLHFLQANSCLKELALEGWNPVDGYLWNQFFEGLTRNTSLKRLNLRYAKPLDDEMLESLISALQRNSTLQDIDLSHTSWEKQGKLPGVEKALQKNARRAYTDRLLSGIPRLGSSSFVADPMEVEDR